MDLSSFHFFILHYFNIMDERNGATHKYKICLSDKLGKKRVNAIIYFWEIMQYVNCQEK